MIRKAQQLKKTNLFLILILTSLFLPGCDSEQSKIKKCKALRHEYSEAGWGRGERTKPEIKKEFNELKCLEVL